MHARERDKKAVELQSSCRRATNLYKLPGWQPRPEINLFWINARINEELLAKMDPI